ncbi:GNAT family N-acetyltransferase [Candidatus Nitrospira neomarina]|uniref:GNAT family N-acetyltransferase n=1 Tax=Candidatus Nitrospira neomarina TaxID=3020899 RepID=A0AA96GH48_9BACT|nr:GNAT family N-acetyltransferase [Candidatus Nitrospira neomarina]WNM60947.1 GNAT family N-acetyltransferase [Candidatus Nitrospira neomarina]
MAMSSRVKIRRATISDLNTIVGFNMSLARETENRALDVRILESGIEALLKDSGKGWYAVAEKSLNGGELILVGQILVTFEWSDWRNGNFWWLQSVYVHPDQRQQQIFRQLYEYVQSQAYLNKEPVCGYRLYVEENNHQAQKAYANLGFQETAYHMYEKEFSWTSPSFP